MFCCRVCINNSVNYISRLKTTKITSELMKSNVYNLQLVYGKTKYYISSVWNERMYLLYLFNINNYFCNNIKKKKWEFI